MGFALAALVMAATAAGAAERIPPAPARHFNDYAGAVKPATAGALDARLAQFERDASSQVVVAVFRKMESDSSIEDYTVRVAQAWRVGRAKEDNGAVLFVFIEDRKMYLQVGYGLEGAIPDALAKRIIDDVIVPRFRARDVDGGLAAGVDAILAAAKGEYRGTGRTVAEGGVGLNGASVVMMVFMLLVTLAVFGVFLRVATVYGAGGRRGGVYWGGNSAGGSWDGGSGGGFGGGFSGGGGSFGGGGAGGSW
jgi:uncharacterized protein